MTSKTLLKGGCILTLGVKTANLTRGDVLLDGATIAEVGTGLRTRDAEVIDAGDAIVMPGFVDAHRHAWRTVFRNLGVEPPMPAGIEAHLDPDDVYAATLAGLLGAGEAGVTTVVDRSLPGGDDAADLASLRAHTDAGLRTVLVLEGDLDRARLDRLTGAAGPTTTLAAGSTLPPALDVDAIAAAWASARELGVRIHAHPGGSAAPGTVAELGRRGLLGPDVTIDHGGELDESDLDAVGSAGARLVLTPSSEMAGGMGSPPIQELVDHDITPGLGVDDERLSPGDVFAQMRATISLQHATVFDRKLAGKAGLPRLMTTRDVIRFGTVEGATAAGLRPVTGSLEPGMQADVLVLRTDRPNIFPVNDPIGAVVWGMDTSNVDHVFVGGRRLVRDGVLVADVARTRDLVEAARGRVVDAAGIGAT